MVNTKMLRSKVSDSGITYKHIAGKMGITPYTLQLKIDNVNEFYTSEVSSLCKILGIDSLEEREELFFANEVDL